MVSQSSIKLSVVAPMFNEAEAIRLFCDALRSVLDGMAEEYEVIIVDDASTDESIEAVTQMAWDRCRVVPLNYNVGHQRAIEAGLALAHGEWVVTMDSDGQHPPDLIPTLVQAAEENSCDVVYAIRSTRHGERATKRLTALTYYRFMRWSTGIPIRDSQADFRLVNRKVLDVVHGVQGDKVLRLLLPALGYASSEVFFDAPPRLAGKTRYGFGRQVRLAIDSVFSFSAKPLRLVAGMGVVLSTAAFLWFLVVLATWALNGAILGWTSVMSAVLLVGGTTLLGLAVLGTYVARIHDVVMNHPRYVYAELPPRQGPPGE